MKRSKEEGDTNSGEHETSLRILRKRRKKRINLLCYENFNAMTFPEPKDEVPEDDIMIPQFEGGEWVMMRLEVPEEPERYDLQVLKEDEGLIDVWKEDKSISMVIGENPFYKLELVKRGVKVPETIAKTMKGAAVLTKSDRKYSHFTINL